MRKALPDLDEPLLDVVSLARRGPSGRLSPEEVALVVRTLRRAPEVIVKVSGGAGSSAGALAHLKYIDRHGELELETDEGIKVKGEDAERSVVEDWELDVLAARLRSRMSSATVGAPCWTRVSADGSSRATSRCLAQLRAADRCAKVRLSR
jgi:hypothetical protein